MSSASATARSVPLERLLGAYCRERRIRFAVIGVPEPVSRILMPEAFLPVIAMHAEMAAMRLLGLGMPAAAHGTEGADRPEGSDGSDGSDGTTRMPLGTRMKSDEHALFGVYAQVPPLVGDGTGGVRAAMFVYALHKVFGFTPDRRVDVSGVFDYYSARGGLRPILQALVAQKEISTWPPAFPR